MVNKLTVDVLEPFLTKPNEKLHLAQISRETKTPHPTARLWLNELEKEGILRKDFQGRLTLYSLNLDSPLLIDYLTIAEKKKLIRKCKESLILKEINRELKEALGPKTLGLIFGSAAEKIEDAKDVDLLIIGKQELKIVKQIERKINKQLHIISVYSTNQLTKTFKEEIIKKHLLIQGSEEILKWLI